jgi:hypothetical protein
MPALKWMAKFLWLAGMFALGGAVLWDLAGLAFGLGDPLGLLKGLLGLHAAGVGVLVLIRYIVVRVTDGEWLR